MTTSPLEIGIIVAVLAVWLIVAALVLVPPAAAVSATVETYRCPRYAPGGYELLSMRLTTAGAEYDCHYVKRGVR